MKTFLKNPLQLFSSALLLALALQLSLALPRSAQAQEPQEYVHATGSNLLRVGDGTTDVAGTAVNKRYLEEIANARIFFQYLSIGLRYEQDDPSEVGRSFSGLRRRWIQYKKNSLELQAGDVNALFGRGLAVNLFESRPLNFDTWLDGIYAQSEYRIPKSMLDFDAAIGVKGVAGKTDFFPIDTTQPMMHISARSLNGELSIYKKKLTVGGTFVQAFTGVSQPGPGNITFLTDREVNQPDFYFDLNSGEFALFGEWTENRTRLTQFFGDQTDTTHTGHAVYGAASYSNDIFGLTLEYKNYRYFEHAPGDQYENAFSKLPISNPPEVYKEFTWTSITRTTHAVFFDDEVGMQAEANITAIPNVTINLNAAAASRHKKYDASGIAFDSTSILPMFKDLGFYPFWEIFAEGEWEFDPSNDLNYVRLAFHRRSDVIVYNPSAPDQTDYRWTTTIAAKTQYETTPNQSLLAIWEHQWEYDAARTQVDKRTLNELVTLQYSFNPTLTFGGLMDLSIQYENQPYHIEDSWFQGFVSLRLGESHTLLASVGSERGGLNCTGGICRVVPPFKGVRLTLTSQI